MSPILNFAGRPDYLDIFTEIYKGLYYPVEISAHRSSCFKNGLNCILRCSSTCKVESETLRSFEDKLGWNVSLVMEQRTANVDDCIHLGEKNEETLHVAPVVGLHEVLEILGQLGGILNTIDNRVLALSTSNQCNKDYGKNLGSHFDYKITLESKICVV